MSGHPKHPKCPNCGRAMYKSPESRAVKKTEPFAFCRNKKCKLHLKDQSKMSEDELVEAMGKPLPDAPAESGMTAAEDALEDAGITMETQAELDAKLAKEAKAKAKADKATNKDKKPKGGKKPKKPPQNKPEPKPKAGKKKGGKKSNKAKKGSKDKKGKPEAAKSEPAADAPAKQPDPAPQASGGDGTTRSDEYQKAATRITNALAEDGPFTKKICELAVSLVFNKDSEDAARDLIAEFDLGGKLGLKLP